MNGAATRGSVAPAHKRRDDHDIERAFMRTLLRSSFLWQFAGGFVLGAVGLFALHPAQTDTYDAPVAQHASLQ